MNEKDTMKAPCYCQLCREKELELYNDIIGKAGEKHTRAVKLAGCSHDPDWDVPNFSDDSSEVD